MSNEFASRRELLVLLFGTAAGVPPGKHAQFIQKVIKHKADSVDTLFDNHEFFFPESSFLARQTYRDMLNDTRETLLKGRKRTANAKGQLEYILDSLHNMQRHGVVAPGDREFDDACHFIYRTLKDYLQFHTRDKRLWHTHPVGDVWVSDDKLTMVYTVMCLPGHYFKDENKLALMTIALRNDVFDYDEFLRLSCTVVDAKVLDDWMFRTQHLVPISEMDTHRNIRCLARQDKLASLASYLMREKSSTLKANRQLAESVINDLPERIDITGPELNVWVSEIKKFAKNQKKVPAPANLIRLDLVWLLANLVDPQQPTAGVKWLTDAWHHNYNDEEGFLAGRFNKAAIKQLLLHTRKQIEDCTVSEEHTDENKFKQLINVLRGLFQNENVYADRLLRQQVVQLRNHLPHYLGLCDNYVAMWNSSLPNSLEVIAKKESLMPNLISYPTLRRTVATVLFSKELLDTTKAELLYALASNSMGNLSQLLGWTQNFKPYEQYKNIQEQLTKSWDDTVEIEDDNVLALGRLLTEARNLAHAPGMDGNPNLAKFLEIYKGYLGISQRMHDEFYKTNKESQMKPSKLHLIDAAISCPASSQYPLQAVNQFIVELCTDDVRDDVPAYLAKKGIRPDYVSAFADHLLTVVALGNDDTYRQNAIRLIGKHLQHPEQRNIQKVFGCCDAEKVLAAIAKTNTLSAAELATLTTAPALQVTLGSLGLGTVQEPASYFRPADDVSHERYPFVGANPSLLETLVSVFTADPGRGLRTLLELSVAKVIMKLADEQLDGAFTYLFRHSTVGTRLNVPPCAPDASAQDKLEHLLFWTLMLCQTPQATVTSFGQPTGPCRLTEDQIATVFAYIGSIEKREILIRIL